VPVLTSDSIRGAGSRHIVTTPRRDPQTFGRDPLGEFGSHGQSGTLAVPGIILGP